MLGVSILPLSTILMFEFAIVPTQYWMFFFSFSFFICCCSNDSIIHYIPCKLFSCIWIPYLCKTEIVLFWRPFSCWSSTNVFLLRSPNWLWDYAVMLYRAIQSWSRVFSWRRNDITDVSRVCTFCSVVRDCSWLTVFNCWNAASLCSSRYVLFVRTTISACCSLYLFCSVLKWFLWSALFCFNCLYLDSKSSASDQQDSFTVCFAIHCSISEDFSFSCVADRCNVSSCSFRSFSSSWFICVLSSMYFDNVTYWLFHRKCNPLSWTFLSSNKNYKWVQEILNKHYYYK